METLQRTANRGSVSTGYDIDNSCKFESDNTEYLSRTPSSASNQKTWTWSGWVKTTEPSNSAQTIWAGGTGSGDGSFNFRIDAGQITINTASTGLRETTGRFRDSSAWYHLVVAMDTTQSTADNRIKLYVNGTQITDFSGTNNPSLNADMGVNSAQLHTMGRRSNTADRYFNGYMAEIYFIDGTALTPTSFGEYDQDSGIWIPKQVTGLTFGTNGFYLDFADGSDLGDDESGNGNDFTETNITAADQATDTPTNNFCIGNALVNFAPGGQTLTEGATKFTNPSGQNWQSITGTFGLTSGKWYWEFKTNGTGAFVGIADVQDDKIPQDTGGYFLGYGDDNSSTTKSLGMYSANGVIYNDAGSVGGASYSSSNIVGVALDMDNRKIHFAVDNTWAGSSDPANNTNGATWNTSWSDTVFPAFSCAQNNNVAVNYGGYTTISISSSANDGEYGTFEYAPPSGYYALCTKNLAEYG